MSAVSEALMRRIGKILALAERGVDGEKAAAESMLATILKRHGLTIDDIAAKPARQWVEVQFVGEHERLLMYQIIRKVTQQNDLPVKRIKKTRSRAYVQLSPAEQIEVEFMFEVMRAAFAKEVGNLMTAFIHRNQLFGPSRDQDEGDDEPETPITPERRAELRRIAAMMEVMSPVNVRRALAQNATTTP